MKGSAITGPVGKEAAELWPVFTPRLKEICAVSNYTVAYRQQFGRCDVKGRSCFLLWYQEGCELNTKACLIASNFKTSYIHANAMGG
jgi:hypothetical protein